MHFSNRFFSGSNETVHVLFTQSNYSLLYNICSVSIQIIAKITYPFPSLVAFICFHTHTHKKNTHLFFTHSNNNNSNKLATETTTTLRWMRVLDSLLVFFLVCVITFVRCYCSRRAWGVVLIDMSFAFVHRFQWIEHRLPTWIQFNLNHQAKDLFFSHN